MSVHNDRPYLAESVESILAQTFDDFELLVIDDGSTDGSGDYLAQVPDPRLQLMRNGTNLGLTCSLNTGLDHAAGKYLARMDGDDAAAPDRFARQVEFLERNAEVGIVGSSRTLIDDAGRFVAHAPAVTDDLAIRWKCLLGNPLAHPTVMIRADVLDRHALRYDERFATAQDYELWSRLLPVTQAANLPQPLVSYRLRKGVSATRKAEQLANHDRIAYGAIRSLVAGFDICPAEVTELRGRFGGYSVREPSMDPDEPKWVRKYQALRDAFMAAHAGDQLEDRALTILR